jgi:hypothetical protein
MDFFNSSVLQQRKFTSSYPKSYIVASNQDALVLKSSQPETRLTFINDASTFVASTSNVAFNIAKDSNVLLSVSQRPEGSRLDVYGNVSSCNINITQLSSKQIVLADYGYNKTQFAGFGYNGDALYYQTPSAIGRHIFQAGIADSYSKEIMRMQYNNAKAQVGIGMANGYIEPTTTLKVSGTTFIDGDLIVSGSLSNTCNFLRASDQIPTALLPSKLVYLTANNKIDDSLLTPGYNFQYLKSQKNVGIGTLKPMQKLQVQGSLAVSDRIGIGAPDVLAAPAARLHVVEASASIATVRLENNVSGTILETYSAGAPVLFAHGAHPAVSIGTSNAIPGYALSVAGNTNISGMLSVGSFTVEKSTMFDLQVTNSNTMLPLFRFETMTDATGAAVKTLNSYVPFIVNSTLSAESFGSTNAVNDIIMKGNMVVTGGTRLETGAVIRADEVQMQSKVPISGAVAKVCNLTGYLSTWNNGRQSASLLARDVSNVLPVAVHNMPDGSQGVQYDGIIPLLVEAIKELARR